MRTSLGLGLGFLKSRLYLPAAPAGSATAMRAGITRRPQRPQGARRRTVLVKLRGGHVHADLDLARVARLLDGLDEQPQPLRVLLPGSRRRSSIRSVSFSRSEGEALPHMRIHNSVCFAGVIRQ